MIEHNAPVFEEMFVVVIYVRVCDRHVCRMLPRGQRLYIQSGFGYTVGMTAFWAFDSRLLSASPHHNPRNRVLVPCLFGFECRWGHRASLGSGGLQLLS